MNKSPTAPTRRSLASRDSISLVVRFLSRKTRRRLINLTAVRIVLSILDLFGIALIGFAVSNGIQTVALDSKVQTSDRFSALENLGLSSPATLGLIAILLFFLKSLFSVWAMRRTTGLLAEIESLIGEIATKNCFDRTVSVVRGFSTPRIIFWLTTSTNALVQRVFGSAMAILVDVVQLLLIGAMILAAEPRTGLIAIVLLGGISLGATSHLGRKIHRSGLVASESKINQITSIRNYIETYREIWTSGQTHTFLKQIDDSREVTATQSAHLIYLASIPRYIIEFSLLLTAGIVGWAEYSVSGIASAIETSSIFLVAGSRAMPSVLSIQSSVAQFRQGEADCNDFITSNLFEFDKPSKEIRISRVNAPRPRGPLGVELQDLSIGFEGFEPIQTGITLRIDPGTKFYIRGDSGSGKSTLADTILGVLAPIRGCVNIGGFNPRELSQAFPGIIGYVPQSVSILDRSIAENIALGHETHKIDFQLLSYCLEKVHLSEFVEQLPDGVHSKCGENGSKISGGQKQRLGLARALYGTPGLLLLDEATNALDKETATSLNASINQLVGVCTVIIITHEILLNEAHAPQFIFK
jgi:ABC-type multidrug transport system fused ATPase/permease subunit